MAVKKVLFWLLPLYPIMFMYMIGKIPLGLIIYTPMLFVMLAKPKQLRVDKSFVILSLALLLDEIIQLVLPYTDSSTIIHIMVPQLTFMLSIICMVNYVTLDDIIKPYTVISVIYIIGLFYQVFQLFVMRIPITGPIILAPGLLSENNVVNDEILRPMSFFSEPQAFATWTIFFLIIMIEKRRLLLAALATVAILLSTSTEGLVLAAVVWIIFILFNEARIITKVLVIAGLAYLAYLYTTMDLFSVGMLKITETDYGENERIVQGFRMLKNLDFQGWIFGIGTSMNHYYLEYINSSGLMDRDAGVFMTSATGVFVTNGIFVGVLFWWFLIKKFSIKHKTLLMFSTCLLIIPFAQSFFYGSGFVYAMSLFYLFKRDVESNKGLILIKQ